ncbi:MAG TPA: hypothetical protein PK771_03950 [Spirochaetota bacterium]|nr:hypothetical protein [Spirochaetota bacterium]
MSRKIFIFFFILFAIFYLKSENLLLKDGRIFKGKLLDISKKNIILEIDEKIFSFSISSIEYLVSQVTQSSYSLLWLKRIDKTYQKVYLIKLTESALFYKSQNDNELKIIKLSNLEQIFLYSDIDIDLKNRDKITLGKEENLDINIEINIFLESLIKIRNNNKELTKTQKEEIEVSSLSNPVNFDDIDFYERFWARTSKFLDSNTENLLWNLLEGYSEKEKSINLLYESNAKSAKNNVKDKIMDLRKDFYRRAKKIIFSNGK